NNRKNIYLNKEVKRMNDINLKSSDIIKLERLKIEGFNKGGNLYILDEETLLKVFYNKMYYNQVREKSTDLLLSLEPIENTSYPQKKLYIDGIYNGYSMPYFKNTNTFKSEIYTMDSTLEQKKKIITDISNALQELHKREIIHGDIHLDNFIKDDNNGYLVDLDDVRIKGDNFNNIKLYNIKISEFSRMIYTDSKSIDNIKAVINFISLIYNFDFEMIARKSFLESIIDILTEAEIDKVVLDYLKYTLLSVKNEIVYFDKAINLFNDPERIQNEKEELEKIIKHPRTKK
ncbi:MAG: hypothetical protein RSD09_06155, partial [Bacilli bacterium]